MGSDKVIPVFIFSLPRSGSTLLQRYLNSSDNVSTSPESWILLEHLSGMSNLPKYSIHSSRHAKLAVEEFIVGTLGWDSYIEITRDYYTEIYSAAAGSAKYFVEKTPRNIFYVNEIKKIFGDSAKYVFLVRNPVAIACSMMNTWGNGYWNIYAFWQDFSIGINNMAQECNPREHLVVKYEELVSNSGRDLEGHIEDYFSIRLEREKLSKLNGIMGDPTGQHEYSDISEVAAEKWRSSIDTYVKKHMLKKLVLSLSNNDLEKLGYCKEKLVSEVVKTGRLNFIKELVDLYRVIYGCVYKYFQPVIWRDVVTGKLRYLLR